jgi:RimJ/RimL family protein N-acetyltransferase
VELVPLDLEHADRMADWMQDREVVRGLGVRGDRDLRSTLAWIENAHADPTCHPFAILAGGVHVGSVVLDMVDEYLATARLSIYVGDASRRGGGVGRRAVELAIERATAELGLHKLWLTVHVGNAAAIAVYEHCGFQAEGVLRDEFILDGERTDLCRMGLILEGGTP